MSMVPLMMANIYTVAVHQADIKYRSKKKHDMWYLHICCGRLILLKAIVHTTVLTNDFE